MSGHTVNKILLKGYYGFGNLGDDILMMVCYKMLKQKYPGAVIKIFSNYTSNLHSYNRKEEYNYYIHTLLNEKPDLVDWTFHEQFDLVFNGGGGVFFDNRQGTTFNTILNNIGRLLGARRIHRLDRWARRMLNKPHHLGFSMQQGFGIGIGPYTKSSPLYLRHLAEIGSFNAMFVRDDKSYRFLHDNGFKGEAFRYTDNAFLSDLWIPPGMTLGWNRPFRKKLCIILQDLPVAQQSTFSAVTSFVQSLGDVEVTFLSFDRNHDQDYIAQFSGTHKLVVWDPEVMAIQDFLALFASHDAVITARAHGAILGAVMGVVPICLGISQKLKEVSKFFPKGGLLVDNFTDSNALMQAWTEVASHHSHFLANLHDDVEANKAVAREATTKLFTLA